jgi:hypothetical protein
MTVVPLGDFNRIYSHGQGGIFVSRPLDFGQGMRSCCKQFAEEPNEGSFLIFIFPDI